MAKTMNSKIDWGNPITSGLVFAMSFIEGTGTPGDYSKDRLSATLVNSPAWAFPSTGAEMVFVSASDKYINLGNPTKLQITGSISIATSFYTDGLAASNHEQSIVAKDKDSGGRAYTLDNANYVGQSSSGLRFYVNGGNGLTEGRFPVIGDDRNVVVTFTSGTGAMTMRITGSGAANKSTTSAETVTPSATANVLIARREYAGFTDPFDGKIRYVYIWNRAITTTESDAINSDPFLFFSPTQKSNSLRPRIFGPGLAR